MRERGVLGKVVRAGVTAASIVVLVGVPLGHTAQRPAAAPAPPAGAEPAPKPQPVDVSSAAERRRSRTEHAGLSRADATALLRETFPDAVTAPVFDATSDGLDGRIVRRIDRRRAVVELDDGRKSLVQSTVPMTVATAGGGQAPVDQSLERRGDDFAPVRPLVPTQIGGTADEGVAFPEAGVTVAPETKNDSAGSLVSDRAFYPGVATDTDYLVTPTPGGIETFFQLRSAASPERLTLGFDLPAGARFIQARTDKPIAGDPPRALEIVDGDKTLGYVYPPLTFDADGRLVPSEFEPSGSDIEISVDHRDGAFRYPLLVDPEVVVSGSYSPSGWPGWRHIHRVAGYNPPYRHFGAAVNDPAYAPGLYLSMPTNNSFTAGDWGSFFYQAQRETWVYRADFGNTSHQPYYSYALHGIGTPALDPNWWNGNTYHCNQSGQCGNHVSAATFAYAGVINTFCFTAAPQCTAQGAAASGPYVNNTAQWALMAPWNIDMYSNKAHIAMGWANVFIGDWEAPRFSNHPPSRGWYDDGPVGTPHYIAPVLHDDGVGPWSLSFSGPRTGATTLSYPCVAAVSPSTCSGTWQPTLGYTLNEGQTNMALSGSDVIGHGSGSYGWYEQIDRTAPTFALAGPVRPEAQLGGGSYTLTVNASDVGAGGALNSGVKRIEVTFNGSTQTRNTGCGHGACNNHSFTIDTTAVEGRLPITVRVYDGINAASHIATQTFHVVVDRSDPEIARLSDRVYDQPFLGTGTFPLRVDAKDFGGTGAGTNTVRNSSFESGLPAGTFGNGGTVSAAAGSPAHHGTQVVRMQATTNGTMDVGNDSNRLAVSAGERVTLSAYGRTAREIRVAARFYNASGAFVSRQDAGSVAGSTTEWRRAQGTVTVPAGTASMGWEVRFVGVTTGEVAFADAVQVERGDYAFGYSPHRDEVPQFERSGVTGMELLVGGTQRASASWTCPGHSCARSHTLNFATNALGEGRHSAQVRVSDGVGRSTQSQPWDVVVDHSAPRITRLEGALRQSFVGPGTFGLLLEATDQGNDAPVANLIPASSFERRLPDGTQAADATIAAEATTAADGARALRVTATGAAPRVVSDANRIPVDPGEQLTLAVSGRSDVAGAQFGVVPRWFDAAGQPIVATPATGPLTPAWTRRSQTVSAPANAATLGWQVSFSGLSAGAVAFIDAVQLERRATVAGYSASPDELAASLQRSGVTMTGLDIVQVGGSERRELRSTWTCAAGSCARSDRLRQNTADLSEGRQRLTARAADQGGATAASDPWDTIVDRSGPQVTMTGNAVGQGYEARVEASDGSTASPQAERSGVVRLEFFTRNDSVPGSPFVSREVQTQECPNGSCARNATFRLATLSSATTIRAVVTDQVGNQTTREVAAVADTAAPNLTLAGTLVASQGMTLVEGAYDLEARATDPGTGMGSIEILLRRNGDALFTRQDYREQPCANGGCPMTRRWVFRPQAYTPGDYTVRVIARDLAGNATTRDLPVRVGSTFYGGEHSLGLEEFWNYDTTQTGAGTAAHVDTATGNLVWHSTPVVNPGRGLSSVLNLTYNSQNEATDDNEDRVYDEAGKGFSAGLSGLTRLNEPLDLSRLEFTGQIILTDVDGTRHEFAPGADGPDLDTEADYWIPPAGVQLHLRRWSDYDQYRTFAATRPDGVTFFFDQNGYPSYIADRNGNEMTFYYLFGHADGNWCPYWDSSAGLPGPDDIASCVYKLNQVWDPAGRSIYFTYFSEESGWPETGRLWSVTDHAGRVTEFTYDDDGNLSTMVQGAGTQEARQFTFHYELATGDPPRGWLTGVTDPRGNRTSFQYQPNGVGDQDWRYGRRVQQVTNRRNFTTQYAYARQTSPARDVTFITDARSNRTTVRSDASGRPRLLSDPAGTNTRLEFDADNNVTTMVEAEGAPEQAVTQMEYNPLGLLTVQVDAEGRRTEFAYAESTGAPALVSQRGNDAGHEFVADLVSLTEPRGFATGDRARHTWRFTVDTRTGNVTERYAPGVAQPARTTYGPNGEITSETSEVGDRIEYPLEHYHPTGRPKVQIGPFRPGSPAATDGTWFFRYDDVGNLLRLTDPRGTATGGPNDERTAYSSRYVYDVFDRLIEARTPVDSTASTPRFSTEKWTYDKNDNTKTYRDGRDNPWSWDYTPTDRVELTRTPPVPHYGVGTTTEDRRFTYDAEDNVTKVESPEGVRTSTADDFATTLVYDALNRTVAQVRTARGAQNADLATSYAYDRRSNVVGVVDPKRNAFGGNPAQNALDPARRRFTYEYDRVNNRTAQIEDPPGLALRTTYGYDADDNRISLTTPRQLTTRWEYDPRGLPSALIDGEGNRTERHYDPDGRLAEIVAPKGTASEATSDYETRFDYYPTGDVRMQSLPLDERQYGPQFLRVFWHRNKVGDPICITDARARTGAPDEDCSSRFSFRNTFFDSGHLRSTERPSWWELGDTGLSERDPLDVGNRGGAPALPSSGNGEGDFASVDRLPLPSLVPDAGRTTFAYDNALELSGITDVEGKTREIVRDATSRIVESSWDFDEGDRIVHQFGFDHNGNQRRFENGRHDVTITTYDQFDRATLQDEPGKNDTRRELTRFEYDANGLRIKTTTPLGHVWERIYDGLDRVSIDEDALNRRTTYTYDPNGNRASQRTPLGNLTRFEYDGADRLAKLIDPRGEETTRRYDPNGNLIRLDEPGSRPAPEEDYRRQITTWTYDGRDLVWTMTKGSLTRAWEYDGAGNLRRAIEPTGIDSDTGRPRWPDEAPIITDPTDADDRENEDLRLATKYATLREYSADNVLTSIHLAWGDADLDDNGQTSAQDQRRFRQDFILNTRGWPESIDAPYEWTLGERPARTSYQYFDTGWIERATEPVFVRPGSEERVGGHMVSYEYYKSGDQRIWRAGPEADPRREMRRIVAPNGTLSERVAEKLGDPSLRRYTYDYDDNRNMTEMVDVRPGGDRETWLTYDPNDRMLTVDERWANGKDTELRYEEDGHIQQRRTDGDFDEDGDYTGGTRTRFTYDSRGAEQSAIVTRAGERARTILTDWFPSGQRARRFRCNGELDPVEHPNAECGDEGTDTTLRATDRYFYRSDGKLIRKDRDPRSGPTDTQAYTYDDNGNRNRDERGTHTFNARNQLTSWTKSGRGTVRYEVNGTGAVTAKTDRGVRTQYHYIGDRMERATTTENGQSATVHYCHSDFGNVVRITTLAGSCGQAARPADTTYTYDEFERMTESKEQDQAPVSYAYDAIDRRDYKTRNGTRTDYGYIGLSEDLSRETRGSSFKAFDYDSSGERFGYSSRNTQGSLSYRSYQLDASGSVIGLEGDDGVVADNERYEYDPYGELIKGDGDPGEPACGVTGEMSDEACDQPFRFQGFYYDSGIKTYDMQARAYRPDIGRFLTSDRYESSAGDFNLQSDPLTQNRYAFAGGNPVNRVEWDGHGINPEPDDPNKGETVRKLNKAMLEGKIQHQKDLEQAAEDRQIQEKAAIQNAVQAAADGDEKRLYANLAVLLKLRQEQLNRAALAAGQDVADAEAGVPKGMTWEDVAKLFFDPSDPLDWASLGGGLLFKAGKTALKLRKAKKLYDTINKARKIADAAKDRLAGLKFAAGRNADLAGQATMCAYNSFVAGTPILMADGTLRPIERVFKGDLVLATDPETGATVGRRVTALIRTDGIKDLAVVVAGGERTIATDDHPFFTLERGWVGAADLRRGEHLIDADGERITVEAVLDLERETGVYNLTVAGLHTYYAGAEPVLVHNANNQDKNPLCGATKRSGNTTAAGVERRNPEEWKRLQQTWDDAGLGDILSPANRAKIASRHTPVVDDDWVQHFPDDFSLMGEKISMHHINRSPITVPLPRTRHLKDAHMPGGTRYNPGGPGRTG